MGSITPMQGYEATEAYNDYIEGMEYSMADDKEYMANINFVNYSTTNDPTI